MVPQQRLYHVVAIASLLLSFARLLSAHKQIYNSTASLFTSWINRPSLIFNNTDFNTLTPILMRRNGNGSSFVCGFYCTNGRLYLEDYCVFGVLIFQNRFGIRDDVSLKSSQLVWSVNRNNPVRIGASLQLRKDGDLALANSDGTLVWSSNTTGKSVAGMNLTGDGNLVLFGRNGQSIWESFHYPTDSLLLGQELVEGQRLTASVSASNWSEGLFYFSIVFAALEAYMEYNPPQRYYVSPLRGSYNVYNVQFTNGGFHDYTFSPTSAAQFLKFGPDGHLRVYQWGGSGWTEVADLLRRYIGDCGYPMVCGNYGVCTDGQCGCLETINGSGNFFKQNNFRQPNLGCSRVTPISCAHSEDHILLELANTSYFALQSYDLHSGTTLVEDCKNSCLRNCSCKAALFTEDSRGYPPKEGSCLLLNNVFSIINNENDIDSFYDTTFFVKVQNTNAKASRRKKLILASAFSAVFGVLFVIGTCVVLYRERNKQSNETEKDFLKHVPGMPTRYSYENLEAATEDFSKKLGEGGFGSVYEGALSDSTKIAVKCLDGLGKVKESFLVEVKTIGSIHHVNLVKLIGYCFDKSHRLLVYQFMANGSLDRWIFGRMQKHCLTWNARRKIISDIAKGLAYLHKECSQKIIHLDIKPQNILLDENFNAKISDFGLSKLIERDQSRVVTGMRGTPGYMAPEWLSLTITEKVDVYSFGIVMLEIICGRKNLDWSRDEEDRHLLSVFKRKAEEGKLHEMVEEEKNEDMLYHIVEVVEMIGIAAWCLQRDFAKRPSMSMVVKVLEGLVPPETNLDYDFLNSVVAKNPAPDQRPEAVYGATKLTPLVLSGPR